MKSNLHQCFYAKACTFSFMYLRWGSFDMYRDARYSSTGYVFTDIRICSTFSASPLKKKYRHLQTKTNQTRVLVLEKQGSGQ